MPALAYDDGRAALFEGPGELKLRLSLDIWQATGLPWRKNRSLPGTELFEALCFSFRRGRSFLRLEDGEGRFFDTRALTGGLPKGDPLLTLLGEDPALLALLREGFIRAWDGELPYPEQELNPERLVQLCAFMGYPRSFYDAVPLRRGGLGVPPDFRRAARALHRAADLPRTVERCGLPQMKSIRRALFTRPELLFYPAELRKLWNILPDPNRFCALLGDRYVFRLLSALHSYPGITAFLADYCRAAGRERLCRELREERCSLPFCAFSYAAMRPSARRDALREQIRDPWFFLPSFTHENELRYSIPALREEEPAVPLYEELGEYTFRVLCSGEDFRQAGQALKNCLTDFQWFEGSTVVVVRRGRTDRAAVQLRGKELLQAMGTGNRPLEAEEELYAVYQTWCGQYGLTPAKEPEYGEIE